MARIVRTHYRYNRPPKWKKPVAIEAPDLVTIHDRKWRAATRTEVARGSAAACQR